MKTSDRKGQAMTKPEQYEIQEATLCMARLLDKYHLNKLLDQLYILLVGLDEKEVIDCIRVDGILQEKSKYMVMKGFFETPIDEFNFFEEVSERIAKSILAKFGNPQKPTNKQERICQNCGGLVKLRNPTGHCDHLYFPENVPQKESGDEVEELAKLNCPTACCVPGRKLATDIINAGYRKPDARFVEVGKIEWPEKRELSGGVASRLRAIEYNEAIDACKAAVVKAGEKGRE